MIYDGQLADKIAIITGAAGGIGAATAHAMADAGAKVVLVDVDVVHLEELVADITKGGGTAVAVGGDVSDEETVADIVARVQARFGGVDILFNNAGIIHRSTAVELAMETWDRVMRVNVQSVFLMCKYVIPIMAASGGGSIINTGSGWGLKGGAKALSYCASKGAVVNMTRALAIDHGPDGIRVNSINPGDVDTAMLRTEAEQLGEDESDFLAHAADRPLHRVGRPEEIGDVVVWLASDASSYVTGSAVIADGGGIA